MLVVTGAGAPMDFPSRVVEPPVSEHTRLRQPLTAGEQAVFAFFAQHLPPEWEIYLQPHLNGLRPDFVLLNPAIGIAVFEVKDWNLDAMDYHVRTHSNGRKELSATKGNRTFAVENPFTKVRLYKEDIYNIYCPRLRSKAGFAAITAGVIFPFADAGRVRKLQSAFLNEKEAEHAAEYWPIVGSAELQNGAIMTALPCLARSDHRLMSSALADDLRGWLVEPDFSQAQRRPLELDQNQKVLSETRTKSGYRRIKGPAGSGKSLVLAARAARLIDEGKQVLIVTYNMTLWHYLHDLVTRARQPSKAPGTLTFTHFHRWCRDVCDPDFLDEYANLMGPVAAIKKRKLEPALETELLRPILPPILNEHLPALAAEAAASLCAERKYDAILVDEGQDYMPLWWHALRKACRDRGEMLLVADATQDLYGTAKSWTEDAMNGAGFLGGRWAQLDVSYRLPTDALPLIREFANRFLPIDTRQLPEPDQSTLDLFPCELRWIQCDPESAVRQCVDAVHAMMRRTGRNSLANADITFLTDNVSFGQEVVAELDTYRIRTRHTFAEGKAERDRQKMAFWLGDARVKATTFQSYKGWESRLLIVHIAQGHGAETRAAIYAALTRLKRSQLGSYLTVVCSSEDLFEYGMSWPVRSDLRGTKHADDVQRQ